jgi:fructokinase
MSFKVVGVGEVLWDLLPSGRQLGGAPANFAYHARALGAEAWVVSRVGDDALGREILQRLKSLEVPTSLISVDSVRPTGTVSVDLAADGQPRFTIHEGAAWDNLQPEASAMELMPTVDAVCFGSLAQRCEPSRSTIRALVGATPREAIRVFDVNLRQKFYSRESIEESLAHANVLKLNDAELPVLAELLNVHGSIEQQLETLARRFQLRFIAYTRGAHGSLLYAGGKWSDHPGVSVKVKDTVGAGDAFTAAVALALLARWEPDEINRFANEVAAFVCSCAGAMPSMPGRLRRQFEPAHVLKSQ